MTEALPAHDPRIDDRGMVTIRANGYQHRVLPIYDNPPTGLVPYTEPMWDYVEWVPTYTQYLLCGAYCPWPKPERWLPYWFAFWFRGVWPSRLR